MLHFNGYMSNVIILQNSLFLSVSEPQAMCYIETSNLDGETNLKIRQVRNKFLPVKYIDRNM